MTTPTFPAAPTSGEQLGAAGTNTLGLHLLPTRCDQGYDLEHQHPALCTCEQSQSAEWPVFIAAIRKAARPDGTVSNNDIRPHIQAIPHKRRGLAYKRAIASGLLVLDPNRREPSTDVRGKNTDKEAKFYFVRSNAA